MMGYKRLLVAVLACVLILSSLVCARDVLVVNSQQWQDVYLGQIYAQRLGAQSFFLTDTDQATRLLDVLRSSSERYDAVILLDARDTPVVKSYAGMLERQGFSVDRRVFSGFTGLEEDMVDEIPHEGLVLLDDTYGYDAISVAPYIINTRYLPVFVNAENLARIRGTVDAAEDVLYMGILDREVMEAYPNIEPLVAGEDRFDRNLEMVKMLQRMSPKQQAVITNGEFLERQIVLSGYPVVFIGKQKAPDEVLKYLRDSEFTTAVLVGNSLVLNAMSLKDATGLSIFVKFAQGRNSEQLELDLKQLPTFIPALDIYSVNYNTLTQQLEIIYQNTGAFYSYLVSTISVRDAQDAVVATLGDDDPLFIDAQAFKTVLYDLPSFPESGDVRVEILFGEAPGALEYNFSKAVAVETVDVNDRSQMSVSRIRYDTRQQAFFVTVQNTGERDAHFSVELEDVIINGRAMTIGSNGTLSIPAGMQRDAVLFAELTDNDLLDNENVFVRVFYGEREFAMVKTFEERLELEVVSSYPVTGMLLVALGVAILIAIFILSVKTEYECLHCGRYKKRHFRPRKCECGNEVFRKVKK